MKPIFVPFAAVAYLSREDNDAPFYFGPYAYDDITDKKITAEMSYINTIDLNKDWNETTVNHARRIAALVSLIESGVKLKPVLMELFDGVKEPNFLIDGHHRVRAYRYLGLPGFWAALGGYVDLMKKFAAICNQYS